MAQGSRRLVSSSLKIKNDSQIAIVFIFADIFLSNSRIGSKALLNAHRLDSILW